MRVLVCGSTGCVGRAVVHALHSRGHRVIEAARGHRVIEAARGLRPIEAARGLPIAQGRLGQGGVTASLHLDFMQPRTPQAWAEELRALQVEAVVNCVGVLMESSHQTFARVHAEGPIELFRGAALAGVKRVVQISALGVGSDAPSLAMPYLHSKLLADDALAALPLEWAVLRPSLIHGPRSQSAALFATLASLPVIALPGRGAQQVQPIHVFEVAEVVARLVERRDEVREVFELGGAEPLSYRAMLQQYRAALGLGAALYGPVPVPLMMLGAWLAEALPQQVFCRDTLRLLERGNVPGVNAATSLLGRAPSSLAHGLSVTRPKPWFDVRVTLSAPVAAALRAALAFMWISTALVSAAWQHESGVAQLLARCGFAGTAGLVVLWASCGLNLGLGTMTLLRPGPGVYALQAAAVLGYSLTAALNMPELLIDHCGPLLKNLPVLALVVLLWLADAEQAAPVGRPDGLRRPQRGAAPRASGTLSGRTL